MEEPSVLDYVKSKLAFWKPSSIEIPAPDVLPLHDESETTVVSPTTEEVVSRPAVEVRWTPVLSVLSVLALALLGQSLIEPPNRAAAPAAFFYLLTAAVIGFAYFRDYLLPSAVPAAKDHPDSYAFRVEGLLIGLVLLLLAFILFGSGQRDVPYFGFFNTALWLLAIGYLIWSFWLPGQSEDAPGLRQRLARFITAPEWRLRITRFGLLLVVVTAVVLFFRFYRLESLPAEMVSDHAEKLLDVSDVLNGEYRVFFPRNTGREAFQFYWTALMVKLFDTGISFMALKIGTVLGGLLTLFYMYRLGSEIGNRWVAVAAVLFTGFSYWANIQSRIGLRFPLYPMFLAPLLFHLIRGLRKPNRTDFIWAGVWLGIGLHGYTAFRIVPFVVLAAILLYILHQKALEKRRQALWALMLLVLISLAVFLPLLRFTLENFESVASRSLSRLSAVEQPLPGPAHEIFLKNTWNALVMFFWDDGDVWVHSITGRPALDVISAGLFFIGLVLVLMRYFRKRNWIDLFLIISIPILLMPSILSLAFPNENPNLNRTAGAYIPVFLILAIGLEALISSLRRAVPGRAGAILAGALALLLVGRSAYNNYDLLFVQYDRSFRQSAWNTSEMGAVIRDFVDLGGRGEDAWTIAYPYWVDTRLVGINAGFPRRDTAINYDRLEETVPVPRAKLFLVNPQDQNAMEALTGLYPSGRYWVYPSRTPGKEFIVFYVPPVESSLEMPAR